MEKMLHETVTEKISSNKTSILRKYQDIYVGSHSFFELARFELLTFFLSPIHGAIGFLLRKIFFNKLFFNMGRGVIIGPNITLRCPRRISLGNNVVLDGNVVLDAKGENSKIEIGDDVFIGKNSILSCASGTIKLGNNVSIGPNCYVKASHSPVNLGTYVSMGSNSVVISGNIDYKRLDIPMLKQQGKAEGIIIGDDVWLGVGVNVIDGARIGNGSVVGAGAVVMKNIPDYSIFSGRPPMLVGNRTKQIKEL